LFSLKSGKYFKFDEMKKMRAACHKLYDFLWDTAELTRASENDPTGASKFVDYIEDLKSRRVIDDSLEFDTKKDRVSVDFVTFFRDFHFNIFNRFNICSRYVRPANINDNIRRHWFFTYLDLFAKAQKLGYYYNCTRGGWMRNPIHADNSFSFNPKEEMWPCSKVYLDKAFDAAVPVMVSQRSRGAEHFVYLDYDNQQGGTHEKIHTLVLHSGKRIRCAKRDEEKLSAKRFLEKRIYPGDQQWEQFIINKDYRDRIIR